jgi:hypothetical protein
MKEKILCDLVPWWQKTNQIKRYSYSQKPYISLNDL